MKRRRTTTRKAGNQRLSSTRQRKQQHLLDVKVRSYKFKQQRNRKILNALFKLVIFTSLAAGVYFGSRACMNRFFWRNPDYNLVTVEINDDGTLTRKEVLDAAHIREGENIFSINLSRARDSIADLAQVDHVEIERALPGKIAITIAERKPIAWLNVKASDAPASPSSFLIDRRGTLIRTANPPREYFHLPIIFGYPTGNLEAGQVLDVPEVNAALTLIDLNSDNTRFQVRGIDVSKGYCLAVTNQNHMLITFGLDHIDSQLERLGWALDYSERTNKILQTANFMVEHNTPVTFAAPADDPGTDAPAVPAVPAMHNPAPVAAPTPARRPDPPAKQNPTPRPKKTPAPFTWETAAPAKRQTPAPTPAKKSGGQPFFPFFN